MRTHYCGELNRSHIDQQVTLCGWAHRRRDHGGVIFIDLRDNKGLAQIVIDPDTAEAFKIAESIRNEYVLKITCKVRMRPEGTVNKNLPTGEVEMLASEVEILNASLTPPFMLDDDSITESIRLENRFVDLRREQMQKNMRLGIYFLILSFRFLGGKCATWDLQPDFSNCFLGGHIEHLSAFGQNFIRMAVSWGIVWSGLLSQIYFLNI